MLVFPYSAQSALDGRLSGYLDTYLSAGYDNKEDFNFSLKNFDWKEFDIERDTYLETDFGLKFKSKLTDRNSLSFEYLLNTVNYSDQSQLSSYENTLLNEFSHKFSETLEIYTGYTFGYLHVPNDKTQNFYGHKARLGAKHNLSNTLYQEFEYLLGYQIYDHDDARTGSGISKGKERREMRHFFEYGLGKWIANRWVDKALIKGKLQYSNNRSNDSYQNYYHYDSYKFSLLIYSPFPFNSFFGLEKLIKLDKISGTLAFSYRYKDYTDRLIEEDITTATQEDHLYTGNLSLNYDLGESWGISLNGSYIWNESNEPSQDFSGADLSFGLHYWF